MTPQAELAPGTSPDRLAPAAALRHGARSPISGRLLHALALVLALAPANAEAQVGAQDRAAAESLFAEGRALLRAGEYRRACAKLEASRKLEPALGTSLNLADCYERIGRTASAWAEFKSAASEAQRAGDSLRKQTALTRADALEPRLCRLALEAADAEISVLQNGRALSPAVLGNVIPIDPGSYRFEASAPGKQTWSEDVEIQSEGEITRVRIPALTPTPSAASSMTRETDPPRMTTGPGAQRALAWTLGGVGVAGLTTGAIFGALAASSWKKAEQSCGDYPYECTVGGVGHADTAGTRADVATAAFIVGAAALGTSIILFAFEPGSASAEVALGADRVALRGRF